MNAPSTFTPQQELLIDQAQTALHDGKIPVLEGMSGFGKSTLAEEVARRQGKGLIHVGNKLDLAAAKKAIEVGAGRIGSGDILCLDIETPDFQELLMQIREVREMVENIIVLANFGRGLRARINSVRPPEHADQLREMSIPHAALRVPVFTNDEVRRVLDGNSPHMQPTRDIGEPEKKLIHHASLGIPRMLQQMVEASAPITQAHVDMLLGSYVRQYFSYDYNDGRTRETAMIRKLTGRKNEIDPRNVERYIAKQYGMPLDVNDPHAFFVDNFTFGVYNDYLPDSKKCSNARIIIYVPDYTEEHAKEMGLQQKWGNMYEKGRLGQFQVSSNKAGFYYRDERFGGGGGFVGGYPSEDELIKNILDKRKNMASVSGLPATENAMICQAHDHMGFRENQQHFGYAIESHLQGYGVPYAVSYYTGAKDLDGIYKFDPAQKKMVKCEIPQ